MWKCSTETCRTNESFWRDCCIAVCFLLSISDCCVLRWVCVRARGGYTLTPERPVVPTQQLTHCPSLDGTMTTPGSQPSPPLYSSHVLLLHRLSCSFTRHVTPFVQTVPDWRCVPHPKYVMRGSLTCACSTAIMRGSTQTQLRPMLALRSPQGTPQFG